VCSARIMLLLNAYRCDLQFRMLQLGADPLTGRTNLCPQCRGDLAENVRAHLFNCATLPTKLRRRRRRCGRPRSSLKHSQELTDKSDVLIREGEAISMSVNGLSARQ
jgi:hypothetical protein